MQKMYHQGTIRTTVMISTTVVPMKRLEFLKKANATPYLNEDLKVMFSHKSNMICTCLTSYQASL